MKPEEVGKSIERIEEEVDSLRKGLREEAHAGDPTAVILRQLRAEIKELREINIYRAVLQGLTHQHVAEIYKLTAREVTQIVNERREAYARRTN